MDKRATLNLTFFIRRKRILKNGVVSIMVRISFSGKYIEAAAGINIKPKMWSDLYSRAIGKSEEAQLINDHLDSIRSQILGHYRELSLQGKEITAVSLKNAWLGIEETSTSILDVFKKHNDDVKKLIGIEFSNSTYKRYETTRIHIERFLQSEYGMNDIPVNKIDYKFIADLEMYFKVKRKCNHNSTVKYLKNVFRHEIFLAVVLAA